MSIGDRIKALLAEKKISQDSLALQLHLTQAAVSKWCRGKSEPDIETLHKIADIFEVSLADLADDRKTRPKGLAKTAKIPIYTAEAAAGVGCLNDTEVVENYIMIDRELLKREFQCNPDNMAIIKVRGDSMLPTIKPGEMVVIEKTHELTSDGLYVMRMNGGTIVVKRIQSLPGGQLNVISDNQIYPPYSIDLKQCDDIAVVGRVIAVLSIERVGA
jgi:transcriptional regulator with XRE-family HTH domain